MEIKIKNNSVFKDAINAINELVDEGKLKFTKDGLNIKETDPTMISMIDFNFGKENFEKYDIADEQEIPISFSQLNLILKRMSANDKLFIKNEKDKNYLELTINKENSKKFSIPVLDLEDKKLPDINLEFKAIIEINKTILTESILDAVVIGETLVFAADKNKLSFFCSEDMNKLEIDLDKKDKNVFSFEFKEDKLDTIKSKYSLEYLKKIEKAGKISDIVKLELGNDYPIRITYSNKEKNISISYVLAPRVED
ncbi:MAG: hypothetical protein B6U87_00360 [Candidatus Aenigmarchaeota archaeon ex4484_52]|nr:MAG: hypothetical protein B6U87_00360 [Candidatus Aenigmarchaeota archaeon ex4484_52]